MDSFNVGRVIRQLRTSNGLTQHRLSELLDISYQQVQKYENGSTRITVELISRIARIFSVPEDEIIRRSFAEGGGETEEAAEYGSYGLLDSREDELLRSFRNLRTPVSREHVLRFMQMIGRWEEKLLQRGGGEDGASSGTDRPSAGTDPSYDSPLE